MRAVVIHEHGGTEVLKIEEVPDPTCNPDGVVLEVKAVGLNHLDTWVRRGIDGHTFPLPLIPGCDFSGVVTEVGKDVSGIQVGDKILAAPGLSCGHCRECTMGQDQLCHDYGILGETVNGGCSEKAALPATNAIPLPEGLSFEQAAAFPLTFLTAWHMLVARCDIQKLKLLDPERGEVTGHLNCGATPDEVFAMLEMASSLKKMSKRWHHTMQRVLVKLKFPLPLDEWSCRILPVCQQSSILPRCDLQLCG